jgi:serine/threonine protein phosphatase PrpC
VVREPNLSGATVVTGEGGTPLLLGRRPSGSLDSRERLVVLSPGKDGEDLKAQDRALVLMAEDGRVSKRLMAIVCDGVTQSPSSEEAAGYVSSSLIQLHQEGLREIARGLIVRREALMKSPIKLENETQSILKTMMEEIVMEKRARSFQTTFMSIAVERNEEQPCEIQVSVLGCGDSCLFVFTDDGELLYNTLRVANEDDAWSHLSGITDALPDSWDESESRILTLTQSFNEDVHLLLCSDGFYDAFATFKEIFIWLTQNLAELRCRNRESQSMAALHQTLSRKKGDDDISFIWLRPAAKSTATDAETIVAALDQDAGSLFYGNSFLELFFSKRGLVNKVRRLLFM